MFKIIFFILSYPYEFPFPGGSLEATEPPRKSRNDGRRGEDRRGHSDAPEDPSTELLGWITSTPPIWKIETQKASAD